MKARYSVLLVLLSTALTIGGCTDYYTTYPGNGPYYGAAPAYGAYPGSVAVAVYDRPYYRGPGYWSGGAYYVWKPGHWVWRNSQKVWIRGRYVVRRYR